MERLLFQDMDAMDRINALRSNADDIIDTYNYDRPLSEEDLAEEKSIFAEAHIKIGRLTAEKKEMAVEFDDKIKIEKKLAAAAIAKIRSKRHNVTETVYLIEDLAEGKTGLYNHRGELIEEKQVKNTGQHRMNFNDYKKAV